MKVFDVIPADFFSVLVSPNRDLYVDALMKLYEMFNLEINIKLKEYINEIELLLEDREYFIEDNDADEEEGIESPRGKARLIERRFEKTGWIEREFLDGSFVEIITPNPYSIMVMRMLKSLTDDRVSEYNSLVFSTFSALNQAKNENRDRMFEALIVAKNNTEKLDYELRTFYHGIRGYLRIIRENSDVNLLLKNHFEEYKKISDRVYHPVKTMDSIFRYSGPIRSILLDLHYDEELLGEMTTKALSTKAYNNDDEVREEILSTIEKIIDSYNSISLLMDEIDAKHSSLTKQSIDKIRYVMSADQSIKGKLIDLLKAYASADDAHSEEIATMLESNVNVNRQEYIDNGSFYHKNIKSRRLNLPPQPIEENEDIEKEILEAVVEKLKGGYSETRVKSFIDNIFSGGKTQVDSKEIEINNDTDYILTLLSVVSAVKGRYGYAIKLGRDYVSKNGYKIPEFVLYKGGK